MTKFDKQNQILQLLTPYANEMDDERLGTFLSLSVGRVLLKDKTNQSLNALVNEEALHHITDWLKASIINNDAWMSNLDEDNRPKKLMKFSNIESIIKEADKVMLIEAQKNSHIQLNPGDESLFVELENGHYVVRLLTPEALDRESAQMQHCIGLGGYDQDLNRDDILFLSLRDKNNKAHATMEIVDHTLVQLQGKQNQTPVQKYIDILVPFLKKEEYAINIPVKNLGYIIDENSNWHPVNDIPKDYLKTLGDLDLEEVEINELPKELIVSGYMGLFYNNIKTYPDDLTVNDTLQINELNVDKIANNINSNKIIITKSSIKNMPKSIDVKNGSFIIANSSIGNFKTKMNVNGSFYFNGSSTKKLPSDIFVANDMILENSSITTIPENLTVKGDLDIKNCKDLVSLSKTLKVGGNLSIKNTPTLTTIPSGMEVDGNINLSKSNVKELPENLIVKQSLILQGSKIKTLPKGLKVGVLDISHTFITELPSDIEINFSLEISASQRNIKLPDEIRGDLDIYIIDNNYNVEITTVDALREKNNAFVVK